MRKDFAKKRHGRPHKRPIANPTFFMPSWAWLVLGAFFGAGLSIVLYWKTTSTRSQSAADVTIAVRTPEGQLVSKTLAKSSLSKKGERRFDFYNLLPNLAQEESAPEKVEKPTHVSHAPSENIAYSIQAGSFRLLVQAEELKAKLAMSGFEASIQTHNVGQKDVWYRVYVGPFSDKSLAVASQQKLEAAYSLRSLIVKNRV